MDSMLKLSPSVSTHCNRSLTMSTIRPLNKAAFTLESNEGQEGELASVNVSLNSITGELLHRFDVTDRPNAAADSVGYLDMVHLVASLAKRQTYVPGVYATAYRSLENSLMEAYNATRFIRAHQAIAMLEAGDYGLTVRYTVYGATDPVIKELKYDAAEIRVPAVDVSRVLTRYRHDCQVDDGQLVATIHFVDPTMGEALDPLFRGVVSGDDQVLRVVVSHPAREDAIEFFISSRVASGQEVEAAVNAIDVGIAQATTVDGTTVNITLVNEVDIPRFAGIIESELAKLEAKNLL